MNAREEYGFTDNGHSNGNGAAKIFHLKPATDPDTLAILDARRNVLADERLNRSQKACFCEVLDRALNPSFFDNKGVVTISDPALADIFSVSARSVYNWKFRIEDCGYWWITKKKKSNMWPLTTYHLTCLHKPRRDERTDRDGTYGGGGKGRPAFTPDKQRPALGARKPGQRSLPLPGSRQPTPESKSDNLQGIAGRTGKELRARPETDCGSDPKPIAGQTRNELRVRPETDCGSDPKPIAGENRKPLRAGAETDCRLIETQNRLRGVEDSKRLGKRAGAASGEGKTAPMTARQRESENDFLALCHQVFGAKEMDGDGKADKGNGGLWRLCFRQNKTKAWAVLHETFACKKDRPHTLKTTWAKFAMDLWTADRLKYDKPLPI